MKILFVHLLNNFTGSPRVLANFLDEFAKDKKNEIHILTSKTDGFLSALEGVQFHWNGYKWHFNKIVLSFCLLISHIRQFIFVLFGHRYDCIYINTILPCGAAFAAKLRKMKIVYHIHEFYPIPHMMQKVCVRFARFCADEVIFVSEYLRACYSGVFTCKQTVVFNSVSRDFHNAAKNVLREENYIGKKFERRLIVLPCALKKYKGVFLFVEIAKKMPQFNFLLVVSNPKSESDAFFAMYNLPSNLKIQNEIRNMTEIYSAASLVMNLSIPHGVDKFIETFSMILIESFEFAVPVIAPCYGGPLEIVNNSENGFLLEEENIGDVCQKINFILSDFSRYKAFCDSALKRSMNFEVEKNVRQIKKIIFSLNTKGSNS